MLYPPELRGQIIQLPKIPILIALQSQACYTTADFEIEAWLPAGEKSTGVYRYISSGAISHPNLKMEVWTG